MSIFAPVHYGSLDDLAESVLRSSADRFGGEDEDEDAEEDDGEPTFDASEGESEEEGLEDEDFDDFEEVEASSNTSSSSSSSHAAKKAKAKKKAKKNKKKLTCAKRLALIEQARSRMWSFNIGDPERAHWERVANARKRAMAKAFCSGVPL